MSSPKPTTNQPNEQAEAVTITYHNPLIIVPAAR